ncbi:MAG: hypothetical protein AAGA28_02630 [Pseudomonadota bacterium]
MDPFIPLAIVAIVVLVAALAVLGQRTNPGRRGSPPGQGHHVLRSDYQSGIGGGNVREWKVPRDPDDYAKLFVPKDKTK